jgi:hypothetical protein
VDPNNASRVAVAYVTEDVFGGPTHVEVRVSRDGGQTWGAAPVYRTNAGSGLPSIAIAANRTIGLLYAAQAGTQIQIRVAQTVDSFRTKTDQLIFGTRNGSPAPAFQPYIGDYFDLQAVVNTFYGTFSATNDLTSASLPFGVKLQRTFTGTPGTASFALPVAFSIDPYFFSVPALAPKISVYYPLRYTYNPATGLYSGYLTLANQGSGIITGPFFLFFPKLPAGVTLANPTGTSRGIPFIKVSGSLSQNSPLRVLIKLRNPRFVPLSTFYIGFPVDVRFEP